MDLNVSRGSNSLPTLLIALVLLGVSAPLGAQNDFNLPGVPAATVSTGVVKLSRSLSPEGLAGRPDSDVLELSNGSRVRLGDVRRLSALATRLRTASQDRLPGALRAKPAAAGVRVDNASNLAAALELKGEETVQLPSGRRTTVAQIEFVRADVEARLGRSLNTLTARPSLAGAAIRVDAKSDWKDLLIRPEATVLEAPDGTRITVGELKQALASDGSGRSQALRR